MGYQKMIEYKSKDIEKVKEDLLNHKIIAFPTDTVFGLGCLAGDEIAKDKIYEAKNRSIDKKLPMMVADTEMLKDYCELPKEAELLFKTFAGPVTLILKYKDKEETVAVRIPNDRWIKDLIRRIGKPLLVTSANISGSGSLIKCEDVKAQIGENVDGIVMEDARGDKASTIINCLDNYKILRIGPISEKQIREVLERKN